MLPRQNAGNFTCLAFFILSTLIFWFRETVLLAVDLEAIIVLEVSK